MKLRTLLLALVIAAVPLAGCIQNMGDLKDRLGGDEGEPLQETAVVEQPVVSSTPTVNTTKVTKPPVARIAMFGPNGALLYKATFQADDATEPVVVDQEATVSIMGSDSEALEPGATLAKYAWALDGNAFAETRQTTLTLDAPGLHTLTLTVTDSHGMTDTQSMKIGVQPPAFDVVHDLEAGATVGVLGRPAATDVPFELKLADAGMPAAITGVVFVASPDMSCDVSLEIYSPEEEKIGSRDGAGHPDPQAETVTLGALPEGTYTIRVVPQACPPQTAIPIAVTVTYLPAIEGLDGGHGGHAGH